MSSVSRSNKSQQWYDFRIRFLSAIVLILAAIVGIWYGSWLYVVMVVLVSNAMQFEWATIGKISIRNFRGLLYFFWMWAVALVAIKGQWDYAIFVLLAGFILGRVLGWAVIVIGLTCLSMLWLRFVSGPGVQSVIMLVAVTVVSDSMAYITGRLCGGPKLASKISPSKTWAGMIGGVLGSTLVGAVVALILPQLGFNPIRIAVSGGLVGLILGLASQAGDLIESYCKRSCNIKDSGVCIPGHGGFLDRFDGLLLAAPVALILSWFTLPGRPFWCIVFDHSLLLAVEYHIRIFSVTFVGWLG